MTTPRYQLMRAATARGKYAPLYRHLFSQHPEPERRTRAVDVEVEALLVDLEAPA